MALFKKNPPAACPKCGKAEGWRMLTEAQQTWTTQASAVNSFSPAPIRGSFGQNVTGAAGKKSGKLRYHCDNCGFEKAY